MSKPKKGKRFNYPLKTLLKVRDIRQRQQQEKLNTAEKELQTQEHKEKKIKKAQQDHLDIVRTLLASETLPPLSTIQMHQHHVKTMEKKVVDQKKVVKKSENKRDDERKELIEKSKEKRIIEKDKEKTRLKWKKMMDKLDSQFLDELSSIKFASKMTQNP